MRKLRSPGPVHTFEPPRSLDPRLFEWASLVLVAVVLLAVRLPFLPPTLEDQDSVNFALGVLGYAPAAHRPHPPGYPVYIAVAKIVHVWVPQHPAALSTLAALASAALLLPLHGLMRRLVPSVATAFLVSLLTLSNPLVLFNGVRPMSDMVGLAFVTLAQLLGVTALDADRQGRRGWWGPAAFTAALAVGVRAQAVWLVVPLLVFGAARHPRHAAVRVAGWFAAGVLVWLIPVIAASGGIGPYVQAIRRLVADAIPVEPLLAAPTAARAAKAAADVFIAPWGPGPVGYVVVALAAFGAMWLLVRDRRALGVALLLWLPYTVYHYLMQWTETLRYAIPVVPFIALLAGVPAAHVLRFVRVPIPIAAIVMAGAFVWTTGPALASYHQTPSPPAQAVEEASRRALASGAVVSGHFGFGRYMEWLPDRVSVLRPRARAEWLALAEYWKRGGQAPVLFFRNPVRTMLLLVDPSVQKTVGRWMWPPAVQPFMRGERPGNVELVQINPPRWFAESGFLLTLEAGPRDRVAREPHVLWVRAAGEAQVLAIAGRVAGNGSARVTLDIDGQISEWGDVEDAFALHTLLEPVAAAPRYVRIAVNADQPLVLRGVTLRRAEESLIRLTKGFHFPERDAGRRLYRWMAPEASALVYVPRGHTVLHMRGSVPPYFEGRPFTLTLTWNGASLAVLPIRSGDFAFDVPVPGGSDTWGWLHLSASAHFVPDEVERNGDRRVLSLCFYEISVSDR